LNSSDERAPARYGLFLFILSLFFLSGASGLVYQVIWVRLLTRIFGSTTFAVSALLAAFMAGLGLGAALAARYLPKIRHPLRWFGALEIGVGLYALMLNVALPAGEGLFLGLLGQLGLSMYSESLVKVVLSFIVLLPPTTLMGASLPLLVQQTVHRKSTVGLRTGTLYAINTLGAAGGCFAAGFYTIPAWGMETTTQVAAAFNTFVGLAAITASFFVKPAEAAPEDVQAPSVDSDSQSAWRWAVAAFTISGFAAIGLEVIWTRLFTFVLTGYTYSFTAMLTVFLIGISVGSIALTSRADRTKDPEGLLGKLQIAIGISALLFTPILVLADDAKIYLLYELGYDWTGHTLSKFLVAFVVLAVPTFLFGAQFPVVSRIATEEAWSAGRRVGALYAMNIVGSIAGALATGYVLIPLIGSQWSFRLLTGSMIAMGVALVMKRSKLPPLRRRRIAAVAAVLTAAVVLLTPADLSWRIHNDWVTSGEHLAHYEEGATATVMVAKKDDGSNSRILVNGSSASNSSEYGLSVNRVQGSILFLFEMMPRKVFAACFGTGITFGTLSQFEVENIDGVDISAEVIRAAGQFKSDNYDVVNDPRTTLHIDDGRNFLLKSREKYDVITMEPMPPALAGVSDMYTKGFYDLCREHMTPTGLMSQWVPLYYLTLDDVKMLYRTFAESFPHAMVFFYQFDTFLVGSQEPLKLSPKSFRERLVSERLVRDLERLHLGTTEQMFSTYLMGREAMLAFAGDVPIVTDDRPLVEFTGPKAVDMSTTAMNYLTVTAHAEPVAPLLEGAVSDEVLAAIQEAFVAQAQKWKNARTADAWRRSRISRLNP